MRSRAMLVIALLAALAPDRAECFQQFPKELEQKGSGTESKRSAGTDDRSSGQDGAKMLPHDAVKIDPKFFEGLDLENKVNRLGLPRDFGGESSTLSKTADKNAGGGSTDRQIADLKKDVDALKSGAAKLAPEQLQSKLSELSLRLEFAERGQTDNKQALTDATARAVQMQAERDAAVLKTQVQSIALSVGVLAFTGVLIGVLAYLAHRKDLDSVLVFKLIGLALVVSAALFVIVAGFDDRQIAPMFGLLGSIAGYLFGRNGESPKAPPAQPARPGPAPIEPSVPAEHPAPAGP